MELRSGRILHPVREKISKAKLTRLGKQLQAMTIIDCEVRAGIDSAKILKDLKKLYEFIIMDIYERVTLRVQIENNRGSPLKTFDESVVMFWKETHTRVMQKLSAKELLRLFPFIMVQEYQISYGVTYINIKAQLQRYVTKFIETLNPIRVRTWAYGKMDRSSQGTELYWVNGKKNCTNRGNELYLECMAKKIAWTAVNVFFPYHGNVPEIFWDEILKNAKSHCCYFPDIDGGCTVVKEMPGFFSMPLRYDYTILETNMKFKSPERDPKKALLLYRRMTHQFIHQSIPPF